jgi:hypothetical protein
LKNWNFLIIAVLYLSLSACASTSQLDEKLPLVTYCDLVANPTKYDEQIVRVRANHISGWEWTYLADENCSNDSSATANATWINIPADATLCEGVTRVNNSSLPHNWRGESLERKVIVVGKFYNSRGGHLSLYPFHMEFICLEEAGKLRVVR